MMDDLVEALIRLVLELLLKGPGYLILKLIRPSLVSDNASPIEGPDGCTVVLMGITFWSLIGGIIWLFSG